EFVLLDERGRIRASTLGHLAADSAVLPGSWPVGSDLAFERRWESQGVEYRMAVLDRGHSGDRLLILLPEPTLQAAAWEAQRGVVVLSLVGAALSAGLAGAIGRTISRPLSAIHGAIRQVGRGELRPERLALPISRGDEVGELADGVAQMTAWLQ